MGEVEVQALRGVDSELYPQEFVVLLGPSGSGKSTLLNILGGLDVPTSGHVVYRDHNLTAVGEAALTEYRRDHVGFVLQFYNLIPSLTARENVALAAEISENPLAPEDALATVGLADRMDHYPRQLSGGQEQRVSIARAIATDPTILVADEPTGDLDAKNAHEILELLQQLNSHHHKTIVMVTHDPKAPDCAARTLHLDKGILVEAQQLEPSAGGR